MSRLEVAVVGAGPRGLSVLERLCANERAAPSHDEIVVHMVDPHVPGAGGVWRRDQSRHLLTNTVASQITLFTDVSVRIDGPVEPGPSLYDWARGLAALGPLGGYDEATRAEAAALGPNDYPTRAFYGTYLHDCFRRVVDGAPPNVTVLVHASRAVAMADTTGRPAGPQGIRLDDGTRLNDLDAIVLAQGHVAARPTAREARAASLARIHHLQYVTPGNPADVDLTGLRPGEAVLLRGLGLNFFDYLALLTAGRGGRFEPGPAGLRYLPSGEEPRLYAFSRRGVPYHARGENEKGAFGRYYPRLLTGGHVTALRERARGGDPVPVTFGRDLWPLIAREVEAVYYGTLLAGRDGPRDELEEAYLRAPAGSLPALLDAYGIAPSERWDWARIATPYLGREFADRAAFRRWLLDHLAADVREARAGNVSGPLKAALDILRDLRNEVRLAVDHGGLDGDSHRDELAGWYTPFNAFLSVGPPVRRIEELAALVRAGVVELTGPGTQVRVDTARSRFAAASTLVPGPAVLARVLVEARLPEPDLRRTDDPLLRHLLDTDQCRPYRIPAASGGAYETGGLAVTGRPNRLVDGQGRAHPRRFAYGVPTEAVHWVTAAGIRPGVDSVTLGDSDVIARAVLALEPAGVPAGPAGEPELTGVIV